MISALHSKLRLLNNCLFTFFILFCKCLWFNSKYWNVFLFVSSLKYKMVNKKLTRFHYQIFLMSGFLIPRKYFFLLNTNHQIDEFYMKDLPKRTFKLFLPNYRDNLLSPNFPHFFGVITIDLPTIIQLLKANEIFNMLNFIWAFPIQKYSIIILITK